MPGNHVKWSIMPYRSNADLPAPLRRRLPEQAQDIFRAAFNHAYATHPADSRREEMAHRIAWAAVKRSYVRLAEGVWLPREVSR
jgi:cation transport regulator